jgi:hypothetical protein
MEKKYEAEKQRTNNYMEELENAKRISASYNSELKLCTNDLQVLKSQKDKTKRVSFLKGALLGVAISLVVGVALN